MKSSITLLVNYLIYIKKLSNGWGQPQSSSSAFELKMQIFNPDGSEANMCGNCIRCFAKFAYKNKLVGSKNITVETKSGYIKVEIMENNGNNQVKIDMDLPVSIKKDSQESIRFYPDVYDIEVNSEMLQIYSLVVMGTPHGLVLVKDIHKVDRQKSGPKLEKVKYFSRWYKCQFCASFMFTYFGFLFLFEIAFTAAQSSMIQNSSQEKIISFSEANNALGTGMLIFCSLFCGRLSDMLNFGYLEFAVASVGIILGVSVELYSNNRALSVNTKDDLPVVIEI